MPRRDLDSRTPGCLLLTAGLDCCENSVKPAVLFNPAFPSLKFRGQDFEKSLFPMSLPKERVDPACQQGAHGRLYSRLPGAPGGSPIPSQRCLAGVGMKWKCVPSGKWCKPTQPPRGRAESLASRFDFQGHGTDCHGCCSADRRPRESPQWPLPPPPCKERKGTRKNQVVDACHT